MRQAIATVFADTEIVWLIKQNSEQEPTVFIMHIVDV